MQEILDQADELADRVEAYEPSPDDEIDAAEFPSNRREARSASTTRLPSPCEDHGAIERGS
jgi:hypothetical protein